MIDADTIDAMVAAGCTVEVLAAMFKAELEKAQQRRVKNRDRMRIVRERARTIAHNDAHPRTQTHTPPSSSPSPIPLPLENPSPLPPSTPPTPALASLAPREKVSRGTRLPEDWQPSDVDLKFAGGQGLRLVEIEIEATKFRNYWTNRTDRDSRKPRWDRAWQNWILNSRRTNGASHGQRKQPLADLAADLADQARELERQAGIGR